MKKIVTTALAASVLAGSLALAAPTRLSFDDSGFDYSHTTDEQIAYVDLVRDSNELRFVFSSEDTNAGLPAVTVDSVVEVEGEDMFGNDLLATVDDLEAVEVTRRTGSDRTIIVNHEGVKFFDTVESYVNAIEELGFEVQPDVSTATLRAFSFGDADSSYRAVFHRQAGKVQVRITAL